MNDRFKNTVIKPATAERKSSRLVEEFARSAKQLKSTTEKRDVDNGKATYTLYSYFKILLERLGYSLIDEGYTQTFWHEVKLRMDEYLRNVGGMRSLTKIEEDTHLDEWAANKVAEYGRLIHGPAPLAEKRGGFGSSVMRLFQ